MQKVLAKSKTLFNEAKKVIPSGVNSPVRYFEPYPFFVKKSKGSSIWDVDGNHYVDFCNGYGALLLGHNRKEIISSISKQLKLGTLFCAPTEQEIELSKLIIKNYPSVEKVRLPLPRIHHIRKAIARYICRSYCTASCRNDFARGR